jgi:RND family efflux transporter MFP subunit
MSILKIILPVLFLALAAGGCKQEQPPAEPPPPPTVTVARPLIDDIINYAYFSGYTEAGKSVELQARVEGYLQMIAFPTGGLVEEGDLLFEIDPKPLEAEVAERQANLQTKKAQAELSRATLKRKESGYKQKAVSELAVLEEKANLSKAEAEVRGAEAALIKAQLDLSYTNINAPVSGRISRNLVDAGNLVGSAGDMTLLATIVNYDPVYVYFIMDEGSLMLYKKHNEINSYDDLESLRVPVYLALKGEKNYTRAGIVDYVDNTVDLSTGTIQIRARFDNSDLDILPGQYARVRIPINETTNALLVPEVAISIDQRGRYLLTVDKDNKVVYKPVETGTLQDGMRVITKGISAEDRVIINGIQRARPGNPVTPKDERSPKQST